MRSAFGLSFLVIALASVLLLVSNLGIRLPVYFLTLQTRPQPLGLWLVLAIAAGLLTSAILHLLVRMLAVQPMPTATGGSTETGSAPRSRRRNDWTFMGRESFRQRTSTAAPSEPWDSAEADWSVRRPREPEPTPPRSPRPEPSSASPSERVIDTAFRVVKPPTTAAEPRPSNPSPRSPAPSNTTSSNGDDWDFVEQDDW